MCDSNRVIETSQYNTAKPKPSQSQYEQGTHDETDFHDLPHSCKLLDLESIVSVCSTSKEKHKQKSLSTKKQNIQLVIDYAS